MDYDAAVSCDQVGHQLGLGAEKVSPTLGLLHLGHVCLDGRLEIATILYCFIAKRYLIEINIATFN
jgi:hypothetical protein